MVRRRCRSAAILGGAAALILTSVSLAEAHPPYERLERVVVDESGRELHLFRSYVDGIFFTDPVKLVVRDTDDRLVAETSYERELSVVCPRPPRCVVFQYDSVASIRPSATWVFERGALTSDGSRRYTLLGIVAPLWTNASGYLQAVGFFVLPFAVLWSLWPIRGAPARGTVFAIAAIGTVPYMLCWLYAVAALSYLSLPWTFAEIAIAALLGALARRLALRWGWNESRWRGRARIAGVVIVAGAVLVVVAALLSVGLHVHRQASGLEFEEPAVVHPLAKASVTRHHGTTTEVFVTLSKGVRLADAVNLELFDGFRARMTREEAEARLGPASGRAEDPFWRVTASYYDRPSGRVSLPRRGASDWTTVGYPTRCSHDYVFKDRALRDQVSRWLPPGDAVEVHVLRDLGSGGLTISMSRTGCQYLVLNTRDGDPE